MVIRCIISSALLALLISPVTPAENGHAEPVAKKLRFQMNLPVRQLSAPNTPASFTTSTVLQIRLPAQICTVTATAYGMCSKRSLLRPNADEALSLTADDATSFDVAPSRILR